MNETAFDVEKLVQDLGGAARVATITGSPRTAPYRWIKAGRLSTHVLSKIKEHNPKINLDKYFK